MQFGLIRETESALASKFKVKAYPAIFLIKSKDAPPQKYPSSTDFSYQGIFEFINIYSETFVFKGGEDEVVSAATKPWMSEKLPLITQDSANDICLKKEGALCVVYVVKDQASKDQDVVNVLNEISQSISSKIQRGISFSFVLLDASQEPEFAGLFGIQAEELPKIVILNPGKRKRFLVHGQGLTEPEISQTLDKIQGGDAKFTNIKGNKLPELQSKYPTPAK